MNKTQFYLIELKDDHEAQWRDLLEFALARASLVEFAVPKNERKWPPILATFAEQKVAQFHSRIRWQCKQLTKTTFVRYQLNEPVKAYLRGVLALHEWQYDGVEDPSFYEAEQCILWTVSHEGFVYIWLNEQEAAAFSHFNLYPIDNPSPPTQSD